uniref:BLTX720 n=1 Tax=Nephila pilipes TaxID=299642 RepID=A0A076L0V2_NEPPI|nr:BLTX720 [Nephila pilipes]
MGERNVGVHV